MDTDDSFEPLVEFFKALSDKRRLRIAGLLAERPRSVEELAANLGLSPATVSHHLSYLLHANLVEAKAQQYYNVYSLRSETLHETAARLLTVEALKETAGSCGRDAYDEKVLADYIVAGRLKTIPAQLRKREVILRRLAEEFRAGKRYPEKRVNEILKAFHPDYATLRRELVNMGLLSRKEGVYWKDEPR